MRRVARPLRRLLIVAVGALVAGACLAVGVTVANQGSGRHWTEVWSDTFNGPAGAGIDQRYWTYETGHGVFGNNEIETMTNSAGNVHLDGHGELDITAAGQGT